MTLHDLARALRNLETGQIAGIDVDIYAELFPPGEPDHWARARCLQFARLHHCSIDNTRGRDGIWFVKD